MQIKSAAESADVIRQILGGQTGPARDIAILNAAAAMVVAGKCASVGAGLKLAGDAIDSQAALKSLNALVRLSNAK